MADSKNLHKVSGNIGLYYVCYQLSVHDWRVLVSKRNMSCPNHGRCWKVRGQVVSFQTTNQREKGPIQFDGGHEKITEDFLISVVNSDTGKPEVYVFTADEARDNMEPSGRLGRHFIEVPVYDTEAFRGRWDKLEDKLVRANSIMAG